MQGKEFSPLKSLDCLSRIFPVKGAIVVGAGMGQGPWYDLFLQHNVEDVLLIEAEHFNVQYLEKKYAIHTRWSIIQQ
ncbi:MAG: hypothetical protein HGA46_10740, partial [Chlorobiaceae bacterium]|nr:hypothetical protein [Chlorobiaceae bacterium]